ncbi:MAG: hypothetical protein AABZ02_04445, partial [Bacteroidota bacterium]
RILAGRLCVKAQFSTVLLEPSFRSIRTPKSKRFLSPQFFLRGFCLHHRMSSLDGFAQIIALPPSLTVE